MNKPDAPYNKAELIRKLYDARKSLLFAYPFYGPLVMWLHLQIDENHLYFSEDDEDATACTDMRRIIWSPAFLQRLTREEVEFVMLHELLHCVLEHCIRGKGKINILYNIAADIVVNSNILESMGRDSFSVDGEPAMHLAPDGKEGREYTAEEVYEMLYDEARKRGDEGNVPGGTEQSGKEGRNGKTVDSHAVWQKISDKQQMSDIWRANVLQVSNDISAGQSAPSLIRKLLDSDLYKPVIDWRHVLRDFIQVVVDEYTYTFSPPDRRFSDRDYFLPTYTAINEGEKLENIWFLIDTSGSIDDELLTAFFQEIRETMTRFVSVQGKISCFDTRVTEPVSFESWEDIENMEISGGGGTDFACIFRYLNENMRAAHPMAIIVLTDGLSAYPDENVSLGIPVLWLLTDRGTSYEKDAPWGKSVHINLK